MFRALCITTAMIACGLTGSGLTGFGLTGPWALNQAQEIATSSSPEHTQEQAEALPLDSSEEESKKTSKEDAEKASRLKARKIVAADRELQLAKLRMGLAEIDAQEAEKSKRCGLDVAVRKQKAAQLALTLFQEYEQPLSLEKARIDFDSAAYRVDHAADELQELVAMYEEEEFAKITKELVIKRGQRSLELAQRHHEVSKHRLEEKEAQLAQQRLEFEGKLVDAAEEFRSAKAACMRDRAAQVIALKEAQFQVLAAEEELEDLRR